MTPPAKYKKKNQEKASVLLSITKSDGSDLQFIDTEWHHVTLTYNASTTKLYKDMVLVANKSLTGAISTNTGKLTIGKDLPYLLDEVQICSRVLSSEEFNAGYKGRAIECYSNETGILTKWEMTTEEYLNHLIEINAVWEKRELSSVNNVVMFKVLEDDCVSLDLKGKDKASDLDSFEMAQVMSKILEMLNAGSVKFSNLTYLLLENSKEDRVFMSDISHDLLYLGSVYVHNESHHLLNSSIVICLPVGFLAMAFNFSTYSSFKGRSSMGYQLLLSQNSWSSSDNVPVLMNLSNISFFRTSSLAISDQLTQEKCFIADLNLSGRDNVMFAIFYYTSPLFTNSSNFINCLILNANLSFKYADQLISVCSSILFFNSSGIETVKVAILHSQYSVNTLNPVYKKEAVFTMFSLESVNYLN